MIELNFEGKEIYFFGDSNTVYVNGDETKRWTKLLCNERNGIERNFGSNGQSLQHVGDNFLLKENFPIYDSSTMKYLWIAEGTNDVSYRPTGTVAAFKTQLIENIQYAVNVKGWSFENIILPTINYMGVYDSGNISKHLAYNVAILEVCEEFNCIYIDIYTIFKNLSNRDELLKDDQLHLNVLGNRAVADIFLAADYTPINSTSPVFQITKRFRISA